MSEVAISFILPTRLRLSMVNRLLNSIKETACNPESLEVVLYIDEDDLESQRISFEGLILNKIIGQREYMGRMTNICYKATHGRFVMLMNDDVVFRTPGWDIRIQEAFQTFKDTIALVYGNDLYQRGGVGTFPVLSQTACQVMGGICPDEYKCSHIDTHLYDIFRKLASLGYNRLVYLSDVIFEHMHYEVGKSCIDKTYADKNPQVDELAYVMWDDERLWIAKRLARYIENNK